VDPVTHSLTGAALSRAGLHRTTPLATATLVLAANAPDVDILAMVQGPYASLALRRGLTHGPLLVPLLALAVAGAILLYDRWWRRRRRPAAEPARPVAILGLALLGALTHSPLDWMNTYGIRFLMPFSERWFYGDSLFIIDPWLWLMLAAPVAMCAATSAQRRFWIVFTVAGTLMVFFGPGVPIVARAVWIAGVVAVGLLYALRLRGGGVRPEPFARGALAAAMLYIGAMVASDLLASRATGEAARHAGLDVHDVMVAPTPANPFAAEIVVTTATAYHLGTFQWLRRPRIIMDDDPIPFGPRTDAVLMALRLQDVRDYLYWSRFPFVRIAEDEEGQLIEFRDARYPEGMRGGLGGITVRIAPEVTASESPVPPPPDSR
jgi:inner membrane protein